jgi:hypothetical protein
MGVEAQLLAYIHVQQSHTGALLRNQFLCFACILDPSNSAARIPMLLVLGFACRIGRYVNAAIVHDVRALGIFKKLGR